MIACSLQKIRNCISIDNDPLQCNYIKQRLNAIQVLPDELQEVDLKKGEFSETIGDVKRASTPIRRDVWK